MDTPLVIRSSLLKTFPEIMFCPTCKNVLEQPTTNFCGHTRCARCTRTEPCICGFKTNCRLEINKVIENIMKEILHFREKWIYKMRISRPRKIELYRAATATGRIIKRSKYVVRVKVNPIKVRIVTTKDPELSKFQDFIHRADMECSICKDTFTTPITTPCGHIFCKLCIECHLFYSATCPLCNAPLNKFNADESSQTRYMAIMLSLLGCYNQPPVEKEYLLPLVTVGSGYPEVLCAIVFSPNARKFLDNLMNSSKPVFGIIGDFEDDEDYGTVIEIRDCVQLPNGSFYVTGIGVRRFRILGKYRNTRFALARVVNIYDIEEKGVRFEELVKSAKCIISMAKDWLSIMNPEMRRRVELIFGRPTLDQIDIRNSFNKNGPTWLWRLINVLPIKKCLLYLLLGETSVSVRMSVVKRLTKKAIMIELQKYKATRSHRTLSI
ncbi:unnamed protein product [Colias eurytheme]|nr:unnamed protein product [Colias eurytheme]